jgi:hypothetical protein
MGGGDVSNMIWMVDLVIFRINLAEVRIETLELYPNLPSHKCHRGLVFRQRNIISLKFVIFKNI